ncbi:MAG TPA: hypothetical protein VKQ28_14625 [Candidatus Acidoferrum sp.]|nr:hypothetical protein [Candidatus Acidoferrum sp.]
MGLYNEDPRFVPMIRDGRKRFTIRARRKVEDRPGDIMHLYTGLRTRGAMLIFRAPCVKVEDIEVSMIGTAFVVRVNDVVLGANEEELLARSDGFDDFAEMIDWWAPNIPFEGKINHWDFERRRLE